MALEILRHNQNTAIVKVKIGEIRFFLVCGTYLGEITRYMVDPVAKLRVLHVATWMHVSLWYMLTIATGFAFYTINKEL